MAKRWEVADWLMICLVLTDVGSEDPEAPARGNEEDSGWLNGCSPGPRD